ncbi:MAG: carbonic anhydrase family protein [Alphaproteobacteria bacterium]|nr:carbonic anhydrase family protein [Alphaproteobacteria bacterium]
MIRTRAMSALLGAAMATSGAYALQDGWSYSGSTGPSSWSSVSPTCSGRMQSPIVIEGTEAVIMHRLDPQYRVNPIATHNDGRMVGQSYESGSILRVGAKIYMLQEFHFHTPAEHQVLDRTYPMSIQFTHRSLTGELAVVSVLVREGKANVAAAELLPNLPVEPGQTMNLPNVLINARDFMPADHSYYRYMGSLSHPPCTEGVNWYVMKTPIEFSAEQIAAIKGITGENARPTQPRNNRIILDAQPQ